MENFETFVLDALANHPDAKSLRIAKPTAGFEVIDPLQSSLDVRARAAKHGMPLHVGKGYVAMVDYRPETDTTHFLVDRE